jgi:hypothetical protein
VNWQIYGKVMAVALIVVASSWGLQEAVNDEAMFGFPRWLHALVVAACVIGMSVHIWRGREQ